METQQKTTSTPFLNAYGLTIRTCVRSGKWSFKQGAQYTFTCSFMGDGSVRIGLPGYGTELLPTIMTGILLARELSAHRIRDLLHGICSNTYAKKQMQAANPIPVEVWAVLDQVQQQRIAVECGVSTIAVAYLWQEIESLPLTLPLFSPHSINGQKL